LGIGGRCFRGGHIDIEVVVCRRRMGEDMHEERHVTMQVDTAYSGGHWVFSLHATKILHSQSIHPSGLNQSVTASNRSILHQRVFRPPARFLLDRRNTMFPEMNVPYSFHPLQQLSPFLKHTLTKETQFRSSFVYSLRKQRGE
jgi:hypothetical protein